MISTVHNITTFEGERWLPPLVTLIFTFLCDDFEAILDAVEEDEDIQMQFSDVTSKVSYFQTINSKKTVK